MKFFLCLYLIWTFSFKTQAQIITIKNAQTNEPIEGATLLSEKPKAFEISNKEGKINLSTFLNSEKITIYAMGYKTTTKSYSEIQSADLALDPTNFNLDEVVVTADKWGQMASNVPSKIISISKEQVLFNNPQTAADLLESFGKVYIQKSQLAGGSPMIRGVSTNRLLYVVDGVRMNTAIFRTGNIQNVISLDPFALENTEVLFGPGSVMYGSDAIGGVMNFKTLTPEFSLDGKTFIEGKALTRFSSANNEKTVHEDVKLGFKKWAFVTSISANSFGDLKMGSDGPTEKNYFRKEYVVRENGVDVIKKNNDSLLQTGAGYSQINVMQKIKYKANDHWDVAYDFHYSETSNYGRYDRLNQYSGGVLQFAENGYGPQKWMMNNITFNFSNSNLLYDKMCIRLTQQYFEESRISRKLNKTSRETNIEKVDAYSINSDFIKSIHSNHTLNYGVEAVINNVTSTGNAYDIVKKTTSGLASRYPNSTWASYGAYITDKFTYNTQLTFVTGIRYNQFILDSKFESTYFAYPFTTAQINAGALTGSAGYIFKPSDNLIISFNFANAFRAPNVDDMGKLYSTTGNAITVPNINLKAENAYNLDLSIAKTINDFIKLDVTGFYNIIDNALVKRAYTFNSQNTITINGSNYPVYAIQNAAVANIYGLQGGIEVSLYKGLKISADVSYQTGEEEWTDKTKSLPRSAPPLFANIKAICKTNKLNMQLYLNYNDAITFTPNPEETLIGIPLVNGKRTCPSWYTFNFKVAYQLPYNITLNVGCENITDQRYRPYASGIVAAGRNFIGSVMCKF